MYYGGTFSTLNIGNSALMAAQIGQDVAGNNISNADTPGYSVESVALDENDPAIDDNNAISSQTARSAPASRSAASPAPAMSS